MKKFKLAIATALALIIAHGYGTCSVATAAGVGGSGVSGLRTHDHSNASNGGPVLSGTTLSGTTTNTGTITGGSIVGPSLPEVLARDVTVNTVTNTAAETTVFAATVPGGTLTTVRGLRIRMIAKYFNSSTFDRSFAVRVKYGATTFLTFDPQSVPSNLSNSRHIYMVGEISAANATNAQRASGFQVLGAAVADGASGVAHSTYVSGHAALAIDSSANRDIEVSVQLSVGEPSVVFDVYSVIVELL